LADSSTNPEEKDQNDCENMENADSDVEENETSPEVVDNSSVSSSDDDEEAGEAQFIVSDEPSQALFKEGLIGMAEILASKFRTQFPYLVSTQEKTDPQSWPAWAHCHSKMETAPASCAMNEMARDLDEVFRLQHGLEIDRQPKVLERYV